MNRLRWQWQNARVLWLAWRQRRRSGRPVPGADDAIGWTKPPAPGGKLPPGAGPGPGAGPLPPIPGPAPGHSHHPSARLLTAGFFTDGCVLVWDHTGTLTHQFQARDSDPDWDAWLQEMTDDQH